MPLTFPLCATYAEPNTRPCCMGVFYLPGASMNPKRDPEGEAWKKLMAQIDEIVAANQRQLEDLKKLQQARGVR